MFLDFSGVIEKVGERVSSSTSDLKQGDEVYGQGGVLAGGSGAFAENISTPATLLTTIIAGIFTVVGGQGPVFTFKQETDLHNKFLEFYNKGKVSAALCNGTSLLLYLKDEDGNPLIQDKNMTGFTDEEEDFSDKYVGKKAMPFRIEDEAKKLGAEFKKTNAFEPFAIKDGNLITCQQQHNGAEVAKLVIDSLGK